MTRITKNKTKEKAARAAQPYDALPTPKVVPKPTPLEKEIVKKSKPKRVVMVAECPSAFPWQKAKPKVDNRPVVQVEEELLINGKEYKKQSLSTIGEFNSMFKEVQTLGSKSLLGYSKKLYNESKRRDDGLAVKRDNIPQNILRGMVAKQTKKQEKEANHVRESGIVAAKGSSSQSLVRKIKGKEKMEFNRKSKLENEKNGPAPNIGFMKGGVFKYDSKR